MFRHRKSHLVLRWEVQPAEGDNTLHEVKLFTELLPWGNCGAGDAWFYLFPLVGGFAHAEWPPAGMSSVSSASLDEASAFSPNFNTGTDSGVVSWEIENMGRVPGILQLGFWRTDQDPATDAPDDEVQRSLIPGEWSTGELPIRSYDTSPADPEVEPTEPWRPPAMRWFPAHLRGLLA